jgi:hypothetical protein
MFIARSPRNLRLRSEERTHRRIRCAKVCPLLRTKQAWGDAGPINMSLLRSETDCDLEFFASSLKFYGALDDKERGV